MILDIHEINLCLGKEVKLLQNRIEKLTKSQELANAEKAQLTKEIDNLTLRYKERFNNVQLEKDDLIKTLQSTKEELKKYKLLNSIDLETGQKDGNLKQVRKIVSDLQSELEKLRKQVHQNKDQAVILQEQTKIIAELKEEKNHLQVE